MKTIKNILFILFCLIIPSYWVFGQIDESYKTEDEVPDEPPPTFEDLLNMQVNIATKSASKLDDTPSIVTVIDRTTIEMTGARTLSDIVRMIPGFDFSRTTIGFGEPIEGFYPRGVPTDLSQGVLFLLNGKNKFNDFSFSGPWIAHKINVDLIERIEVIRGPGSALYGGNAFTAVINIITRDRSIRPETLFEVSYGQFNYLSLYVLTKHEFANDWHFGFQGKYFMEEGTSYPSLTVDRSYGGNALREPYLITDGINPSLDLSLSVSSPNEKLKLQGWYTYHDPHPMLAGYYPTPNNGNYYYRTQQLMFNLDYEPIENLNIGAFYTFMRWDWRTLAYDSAEIRDREITYLEDDLTGAIQRNRQWQLDVNYTFHLGKGANKTDTTTLGHEILVGATYSTDMQYDAERLIYDNDCQCERYSTDPADSLIFYPDFTRHQFSLFVQDNWQLNRRLAITGGLRFDYYDDIGINFNPRFGLVLKLRKESRLKVLYGEGFRPPGGFELKGIQLGPLTGNPRLKAEKIRTGELAYIFYIRGLDKNNKKRSFARIQMGTYASFVQDAIFSVDDGNAATGNPYFNIGQRRVYGTELEIQGKRWWANYSFIFSETADEEGEGLSQTPFVAGSHFNAGIFQPLFKEYEENGIRKAKGLNGLVISSQIFYRSSRLRPVGTTTLPHFEWDMKLTYRYRNLEMDAGFRNILNTQWGFPLNDGGLYEFPYRGREFYAKIRLRVL